VQTVEVKPAAVADFLKYQSVCQQWFSPPAVQNISGTNEIIAGEELLKSGLIDYLIQRVEFALLENDSGN